MADEIIELKTVDSMPGSINELISMRKPMRRPPSLSESFAWTPENIQRAYLTPLLADDRRQLQIQTEAQIKTQVESQIKAPVESQTQITDEVQQKQTQITSTPQQGLETRCVNISVKLLLHISLISVFESLFFFFYVSTLEDNGILKTVDTFIHSATTSCQNLTTVEKVIVNDLLTPFVNASQIFQEASETIQARSNYNSQLMNTAWYYVAGLSGLFVFVAVYVKRRKLEIEWKKIILENTAMVLLLAVYEYMFFETIIYNYRPITAIEIERNAVLALQSVCGIL